jgi:hypothetical protein
LLYIAGSSNCADAAGAKAIITGDLIKKLSAIEINESIELPYRQQAAKTFFLYGFLFSCQKEPVFPIALSV